MIMGGRVCKVRVFKMVVVEHDDVLKLDKENSDFEVLLTFSGFKHHPLEPVPGFGQFSTKNTGFTPRET